MESPLEFNMSQEDLINGGDSSLNGTATITPTTTIIINNNGEKGLDGLQHIDQQCQEKSNGNIRGSDNIGSGSEINELLIKEKLEKITKKNIDTNEKENQLLKQRKSPIIHEEKISIVIKEEKEEEQEVYNSVDIGKNDIIEESLSSSTTTSSPPSENQDALKFEDLIKNYQLPDESQQQQQEQQNQTEILNQEESQMDNNHGSKIEINYNNTTINNDNSDNNNNIIKNDSTSSNNIIENNNHNSSNNIDNINSYNYDSNNSLDGNSYKLYNFTINVTPKIQLPKNKLLNIENLQLKTHQINKQKYSRRTSLLSKRYKSIRGGGSFKKEDEAVTFGGSRLFESLFSSGASCSKILRDSFRVEYTKVSSDILQELELKQDRNASELQSIIIQDEDLESSSDEEKSYSKSLRERKTLEELEKGINRQLRDKIEQLNMNKQFFESNLGRKKITLTKEQQEEQQFLESNLFHNTPIPKDFNINECTDGPYDLLYYTIHPLRGLDKRIDSTLTKSGKRRTLEDQLKESGVETPSFKMVEDYQPYNVDISRRFISIYKSGTLLSHISHNPNAPSLVSRHHHRQFSHQSSSSRVNSNSSNNNNRSNRYNSGYNSPQNTPNLKQSFNSKPIPITPLQSPSNNVNNISIIKLWNKANKVFHPTNWSHEEIMIFDEMIYVYGFDWTEIARILCGVKSPIQMYKFYSKQQQHHQQQELLDKPLDEQQMLILNHEKEFYNDWNRICYSCFLENCCNKKVSAYKNLEKLRRESIYESFVVCSTCECSFHLDCVDPPLTKVPDDNWYCSNECSSLSQLKCEICYKEEKVESMALCLTCNKGYHIYCLDPPLQEVPINDWDCISCSKIKIQEQSNTISLLQELPKLERYNTSGFENDINNNSEASNGEVFNISNNNESIYNSNITLEQSSASITPNLSIPISNDMIFKDINQDSLEPPKKDQLQDDSIQQDQLKQQQNQLKEDQMKKEQPSTPPPQLQKEELSEESKQQEQKLSTKDQEKHQNDFSNIIKSPLLISDSTSIPTTPITKNNIISRANKNEISFSSDSILDTNSTPNIKSSSSCIPQSPSALGSPTFFRRSINSPLFNSTTLLYSSSNNLLSSSTNGTNLLASTNTLHSISHISGCPYSNNSNNDSASNDNSSNNNEPSNNSNNNNNESTTEVSESNLINARFIAKEGQKLAASSVSKPFITLKKLSEVCLGCLVQAGLFEDSPFINTPEVYNYVDTIQSEIADDEIEIEAIFSRRIDILLSSILFATQSMIEDPELSNQEEFEQQQEEQNIELENIRKQLKEQIKLQEKQRRFHKNSRKEKDIDIKSSSPSQLLDSSINTPLLSSESSNNNTQVNVASSTPTVVKRAYKKRGPKTSTKSNDDNNLTATTFTNNYNNSNNNNNSTGNEYCNNSTANVNMNVQSTINEAATPSNTLSPTKSDTPNKKRSFEESQKTNPPVPLPPPLTDELKDSIDNEELSISSYYFIIGKNITSPLVEDKPLKRYKRSKKFSTKGRGASEEDNDSGLNATILSSLNNALQQAQQQQIQQTQQLPTPQHQQQSSQSNIPPLQTPSLSLSTPTSSSSNVPNLQSLTGQIYSSTFLSNLPTPASSLLAGILPFLPSTANLSLPTTNPSQHQQQSNEVIPKKRGPKKKITDNGNNNNIQNSTLITPPIVPTPLIFNNNNTSHNNSNNSVSIDNNNQNSTALNESRTLLTSASISVPTISNSSINLNEIISTAIATTTIPTTATSAKNTTASSTTTSITTTLSLSSSSSSNEFKSAKTKDTIGVARGRRERLTGADTCIKGSRWWIFSGNPKIKQELNSMEPNLELDWVVRQHSDNIRKDDKVFIWLCGKFAGIQATAVILNDPERLSSETPTTSSISEPVLYQSNKPNQHHTLRIRIEKVLPALLPKKYLVDNPDLTNMTIIRAPLATNFWVNDSEAKVLCNMFDSLESGTLEIPNHYYEQPNPIPAKKGRKPGSTNKSSNNHHHNNNNNYNNEEDENIGSEGMNCEGNIEINENGEIKEVGKKRRRRRRKIEMIENCTLNPNLRNCSECNNLDEKENMITCDTCCSYYHSNCLSEPIDKANYSYWICFRCCMNNDQILNCKLVIGWLEIKSKIKRLLFKKCEAFSFNLRKSLNVNNRANILNKLLNFSILLNNYRSQLTRLVNQRYFTWYSSLNSSNQFCNGLSSVSNSNNNGISDESKQSFNAFELDSKLLKTRPRRKESSLTA